MKKINFNNRKCIVCKKINKKNNLNRLICIEQEKVIVDNENKFQKRGYYICNNEEEKRILLLNPSKYFKKHIKEIKL